MNLLDRYLDRVDYESYEDFRDHCRIHVPERFNFGYDVVDEYTRLCPEKRALVWCDDAGTERVFTFAEMKLWSDRTANLLRRQGVGRGTPVMLILKGRYEFWFFLLALHKLGAVAIPATHMLTTKDLVYRIEEAGIKLTVAVHDPELMTALDAAHAACPGHETRVAVAGGHAPEDRLKRDLQQHVKAVAAPYKYPRIVEFVETPPKTISGKIRRTEIR